jgi:hypothetical protein
VGALALELVGHVHGHLIPLTNQTPEM